MPPEASPREARERAAKLERFAELLRESPHNLLSSQGLHELEARHLPESVAFAHSLPASGPLLDVGSGGGLPGIVIAIERPDLVVHLLDATGKKATFLRDAAEALELDVTVHHGRAEDLGAGPLARGFGVVTARALAPLDRLIQWCAPFVRSGGSLHAIKGERWREELADAEHTLTRLGLRVASTPDDAHRDEDPHQPRVLVIVRND
jgi:16S rRNA (guanine527-N7)-methyltransferase